MAPTQIASRVICAQLGLTRRAKLGVVPTFPCQFRHANPSTLTRSASTSAPQQDNSISSPSRSPFPARHFRLLVALAGAGAGAFYLSRSSSSPSELSPATFTPLRIAAVRRVTPDTSVFSLEIPAGMSVDGQALAGLGQTEAVVSVWLKQPDLQIQRAYTPLDSAPFFSTALGGAPRTVDLLVKRYADGELSRWLHRLNVGDAVGVRGGVLTWATPQVCDEVVFVVGGTGITPAYQFLRSAFAPSSASAAPFSPPKISIVYSSPTPSTILLKQELDALACQHPDRVTVRYLVDREDGPPPPPIKAGWSLWGSKPAAPALQSRGDGVLVGRAGAREMGEWLGRGTGSDQAGPRRVVVVCGPEGMVNAVAGPRARDLSQGPIGGVLGELGYGRGEVVKL